MYADGLVLCGESEEEMRVMTHRLLIVCKRCVPNVNANKVKLMVLGGEEGTVREISVVVTLFSLFRDLSTLDLLDNDIYINK